MNREKMIADELQCMFLEGKLQDFNEVYINSVTKQLRTGEVSFFHLAQEDSDLKGKVLEAFARLCSSSK
jgi:hypothetical protein